MPVKITASLTPKDVNSLGLTGDKEHKCVFKSSTGSVTMYVKYQMPTKILTKWLDDVDVFVKLNQLTILDSVCQYVKKSIIKSPLYYAKMFPLVQNSFLCVISSTVLKTEDGATEGMLSKIIEDGNILINWGIERTSPHLIVADELVCDVSIISAIKDGQDHDFEITYDDMDMISEIRVFR